MYLLTLWERGEVVGQHRERGAVPRAVRIAGRELARRWDTLGQRDALVSISDEDGNVVAEVTLRRL